MNLVNIIKRGESLKVEFKQRFSSYEKIAKEIIAFANTDGGTIIFGINDNGTIHGVESEKSETELIEETINNFCEPFIEHKIKYFEINGKEMVVLDISKSKNKPHRIKDYKEKLDINNAQVFVRVKDRSIPAGKEMIKLMQKTSSESKLKNYSIGKNEKIVFNYLEENEFITVKQLNKLVNISSRRASRTLINLVRANILAVHTKDNGEDYFSNLI